MKVTAEAVKQVIGSQPVDTLVAEDIGSGEKVGYCQGTVAELNAQIDFLEDNMLVPYRVKLSSSKVNKRAGVKSVDQKPFVFILQGRSGGQAVNGHAAPAAPSPAPVELVRESATNAVRNEVLNERVKALQEELDKLKAEAEIEDEEEEEEEEPEPINAAPQSVWNSPEVAKELLAIFKPIGEAAGQWVAAKAMKNGKPVQATAAQTRNVAEDMTDEERRLLVAVRNWKAAQPEQHAELTGTLMEQFAAVDSPNDESAQQ